MKIIEPSVEILQYPEATDKIGVCKFLEKIGRTCYKSEDKITDDSYKKMIDNLIKNRHTSVLEHYTYIARIDENFFINIINNMDFMNPYNKFVNITRYRENTNWSYLMSYSLATKINMDKMYNDHLSLIIDQLERMSDNGTKVFLTQEEILKLSTPERLRHQYITVKFICDRGLMAEITRHRQASFSVESTRYANYSLDKFGNEITVICPFNKDEVSTTAYERWYSACKTAEDIYIQLTTDENSANKDGVIKPQIARSVLPNSLKTEIVMTAPLWSWINFFNLRMAPNAHPQMQELATMLFNKLIEHGEYKILDSFVND